MQDYRNVFILSDNFTKEELKNVYNKKIMEVYMNKNLEYNEKSFSINQLKYLYSKAKYDILLLKHNRILSKPDIQLSKSDIKLSKPDIQLSKPDIKLSKPSISQKLNIFNIFKKKKIYPNVSLDDLHVDNYLTNIFTLKPSLNKINPDLLQPLIDSKYN